MKRIGTLLLAMLFALNLTLPALAAEETAVATTLRLISTEGTVALANQNDRKLTIRDDLKLYSGYTIKTSAASYAYISLDSTKAIKLDASTSVEIRKSGKKLEVLLNSGKIFFNVSAPLADDETLEIRTSTIVTGIRGTAGIVNYIDANSSQLSLLTGTVAMLTTDPVTHKTRSVTVQAGQTAVATRGGTGGQPNTPPAVTVSALDGKDVPGFAAVEVVKNPDLQQKVLEANIPNGAAVTQNALETLVNDQKVEAEAVRQVENIIAQAGKSTTAPLFPTHEKPTNENSTGGDNSGARDPSPTPTPTPAPVPTSGPAPEPDPDGTVILTKDVSVQRIQLLLLLPSVTTVQLGDGITPLAIYIGIGSLFIVPTGKTLSIKANTSVTIETGASLDVFGILENEGTLTSKSVSNVTFGSSRSATAALVRNTNQMSFAGNVDNRSRIENSGTITTSSTFANSGALINSGTLGTSGTWTNDGGSVETSGSGVFSNSGVFNMERGVISNTESGFALTSVSAGIHFTGGFFKSKGTDCISPGSLIPAGLVPVSGTQGDINLLGASLENMIVCVGATPTVIKIQKDYKSAGFTTETGQDIKLDAGADGSLALSEPIQNKGTLTLTANESRTDAAFKQDSTLNSNNQKQLIENAGNLTVTAHLSVIGTNPVIKNQAGGTVEVLEHGMVSGVACGIENADTNDANSIVVDGGTVESTTQNTYTINGKFIFKSGTVRAKAQNFICNPMPDGYEASPVDTNGWFTLVKKP